jgi:RNA-directed DNA polymerase
LGIDIGNGLIRPNRKSRRRLLTNVSRVFDQSASAFRSYRKTGKIFRSLVLIHALSEASGIVSGWGKHYSFCNDKIVFAQLDSELSELLRRYLGAYADETKAVDQKSRRRLIGIPLLDDLACNPFVWPKSSARPLVSANPAIPPSSAGTSRLHTPITS